MAARRSTVFDTGDAPLDIRSGIIATAKELGMDPVDLATIISYETGGTFDPTQGGPTTKWGKHRGLIQFGEPQAKQYGVDWNDPLGSQLGPGGAVTKYFQGSGWKPGMGMLDAYSIVNAGGPGRYNASDAGAGGAPGSVRDKVERQMGGHRQKAMALLGDAATAPHVSHPPNPQTGTGGYVAPGAPTIQPGETAVAGNQDKYGKAIGGALEGFAGMSAPTLGSSGTAPRQLAPQSIPSESMPIVSGGDPDRNAMAMLMARLNSGQLWG
jgi:hypothetical protein